MGSDVERSGMKQEERDQIKKNTMLNKRTTEDKNKFNYY